MDPEAIRLLWIGTALGAGITVFITLIAAAKSIPRWSVGALVILGSIFFCGSFYGLAGTAAFFRSRPNITVIIYALIWVAMFGLGSSVWPKAKLTVTTKKEKEGKPNIKLIEITNTEGSISQGIFLGVPIVASQPFPTILVCFRNQSINKRVPTQPHVNAHVIYRNSANNEIADLLHGVWIGERGDYTALDVGAKKCLVLLTLANSKLSRWWQEEYHTQDSWMGGPLFRSRHEELRESPRHIVVELLDQRNGKLIKRFVLKAKQSGDGILPVLKVQSAFWSFLRRD